MPRLLSLFDGTGSITKPFVESGIWEVDRVDIDGIHGANLVVDILKWTDYINLEPYDLIIAGVPCEQVSIARTTAKTPRNLTLHDALVEKTKEIIKYFLRLNPECKYFVENPASSLMWKRPPAEWFEKRIILDFCQYGKPYRKRTCLATNSNFTPRKLCEPKSCPACPDGKTHKQSAQRGPCKNKNYRTDRCSLDELHAYPEELCREIYKFMSRELIWEVI